MANYAIGDLQGCFKPLQQLLTTIRFEPTRDRLWLTGDLVNRGPESLKVLRFLKKLPLQPYIVLGNHDLHFLAVAYQALPPHPKDTFQDILAAEDKEELCDWLRHQPMLQHDTQLGFTMTHAGIFPLWSLEQAKQYAKEIEQLLQGEQYQRFLTNQYGDSPNFWREDLAGWERYRFIVNSFTRMRLCTIDGRLELITKTGLAKVPEGLLPWFEFPDRRAGEDNLLFGHWAALNGKVQQPHIFPLDTGCIWGGCLTAMRLEDQQYFRIKCLPPN